MVFSGDTMSYKDKYEHALDRFTAVCKDMFTDLERLKRENQRLREALEAILYNEPWEGEGVYLKIAKKALEQSDGHS